MRFRALKSLLALSTVFSVVLTQDAPAVTTASSSAWVVTKVIVNTVTTCPPSGAVSISSASASSPASISSSKSPNSSVTVHTSSATSLVSGSGVVSVSSSRTGSHSAPLSSSSSASASTGHESSTSTSTGTGPSSSTGTLVSATASTSTISATISKSVTASSSTTSIPSSSSRSSVTSATTASTSAISSRSSSKTSASSVSSSSVTSASSSVSSTSSSTASTTASSSHSSSSSTSVSSTRSSTASSSLSSSSSTSASSTRSSTASSTTSSSHSSSSSTSVSSTRSSTASSSLSSSSKTSASSTGSSTGSSTASSTTSSSLSSSSSTSASSTRSSTASSTTSTSLSSSSSTSASSTRSSTASSTTSTSLSSSSSTSASSTRSSTASSTTSTSLSSSKSTSTSSSVSSSSSTSVSSSTSASSTSSSRSSSSSSSSTSSSSTSSSSSRSSSSSSSSTSSSSTTSSSTSSSSTSSSPTTSSSTSRSSTSSSSTSTTSTSSRSSSSTSSSSTSSVSPTATVKPCSFWLEDVKHQGIASFNSEPGSYQVFRNVKDFGAKGDGVTDDTAAINAAISAFSVADRSVGRCGPGACSSSSNTPATVYFPNGTYIVSSPIIDYYYTQIIGNPNCMPIIKATSNFPTNYPYFTWVIDGDEYGSTGTLDWLATNVFWRQIRNIIVDMTDIPAAARVAGIHWPTAQATSLQNILVKMSTASGVQHVGVYIESGSGGFLTDLVLQGGNNGAFFGNQQFTTRNLTFSNAVTAIYQVWDWGWTYKGITINNCQVGLDMTSSTSNIQNVGSIVLFDSDIKNTPIGIKTARSSSSAPAAGGSLILENVRFNNVQTYVQGPGAANTPLAGSAGQATVAAWGQGYEYLPPNSPITFSGSFTANVRPTSLTSGTDYYERSKPQYQTSSASQFVSVRDNGAKGDGSTDDSDALIAVLALAAASGKIVFFDAGNYLVTKTIPIPAGSKIVGEAYPVILSSGTLFNDMTNPLPVVQVGAPGESGSIEWSDMIVSTQGNQAGAILIEWNLAAPTTAPSGMWDVHTRIGGFLGSELQLAECPLMNHTTVTSVHTCIAAFISMHITSAASGLYMENNWFWVADHDVDDPGLTQITVYAGRGLLIESVHGGIWLYGTAVEHHTLYQYQLSGTKEIYLGQIQTETAYYQPNPNAPTPFPTDHLLNDPIFNAGDSGWGLRILGSLDVLVYGAGLYSFFRNNDVTCSNQGNGEVCQHHIFSLEGNSSAVSVYGLNTVGVTDMVSINGTDGANYAGNENGFIDSIVLIRVP